MHLLAHPLAYFRSVASMCKDNPKTGAIIIVIPAIGINDIEQNNQNATIYNLSGQRLSKMQNQRSTYVKGGL